MDLKFFLNKDILDGSRQFFKEILDINVAPAVNTEIKIQEFLKDHLTDTKLLSKVADARIIGMINTLSINDSTTVADTDLVLKNRSEDYDMLLVFGIEIDKNDTLTKTDISRFTRALNRRSFNRPVVLLLKYSNQLSFSAAERGLYKRKGQQGEKIGRISILRDVSLSEDIHAGHERILLQLRINPLKITKFNELYNQWCDVFNLKTLNNDFYKKIADWYFWATKVVKFPIDHYKTIQDNQRKTDEELQAEANQIALIRFITRIIFVWFLKSKDSRIILAEVFDYGELKKHLRFNDEYDSNYYKAILQNLFFASFNTKIDSLQRTFSDQMRTTFLESRYRYSSLFSNPEESVKKLFSNIPFLNGGLFSNLDYKESDKRTIRVDWFSDPAPGFPKNKLYFPDFLFFDEEHEEDLSDFYETKAKQRVKGLIPLLKEYYFTIEENTPLEQEIALDPELLGKIFENLLASYNPETRTTARKLTGSFYTPREIVNYMVDESLIAFLKTKLTQKSKGYQELGNQQTNIFGNEGRSQLSMQVDLAAGKWDKNGEELETKLRELFSYEKEENPFQKDKETNNEIITHLSECKILDPACGSGAFPMGMLHQIVHALKKLDSDNEQWKQVQYERLIAPEVAKINGDISTIQKLSSDETRKIAENQLQYELEELLENFTRHDHNYTRKLHLIENCIYGVDIQTVAIHISKLRFFISLLVDQNIDFSQRHKNYLLNSLPNLETKFVAANTLIPLNPGGQLKTREADIITIEEKIKAERKKYFDCKSREEKLKIEKKDEALRIEFATALKKLTELGRNNLLLKIQTLKAEIDTHNHYKAKAQTDRDKARIAKGIEALKKDLEKQTQQLEQYAGGDDVANKILHFNPYDANSSAPFFDPEIMFALQPDSIGGFFDIVLGNPPYIQLQSIKEDTKAFKKANFSTFNNSGDIYCLFYEKAFLCLKAYGIVSYISSNRFCFTNYGINLREYLGRKETLSLININNIDVFDKANVGTLIYIGSNTPKVKQDIKIAEIKSINAYNSFFNSRYDFLLVNNEYFEKNQWCFYKNEILAVKKKIENKGQKLYDLSDLKINRGLTTGANEIFIVSESKKDEFINEKAICKEVLKPVLKGADIKRWLVNSPSHYIIYAYTGIDIKKYEPIYNYFTIHKSALQEVYEAKNKQKQWYELRACSYYDSFAKEKLIWTRLCSVNSFAISKNAEFSVDSTSFAIGSNLKYYCCLLNSKLILFYFKLGSVIWGKEGIKWFGDYFDSIPIIPASQTNTLIFENYFDEIIEHRSVLINEKRLDLMVYKLYALTYNECKLVDPGIEKHIGSKDYEKATIEALAKY